MISRLPNGNILIPVANYDPVRGIDSDGAEEIAPDHPRYAEYRATLERYEAAFGHPLIERHIFPQRSEEGGR
jgi:hypothetical protein